MVEQLELTSRNEPIMDPVPVGLLVLGLSIFVLVVWAFSPALFSYGTSDDFLILSWLRQSEGKLSVIASQFAGPWLGLTAIKYYRPLPMLDWSIQYALWHGQLLNYHIANFVTYGVISLLVFLVALEITTQSNLRNDGRGNVPFYPFLAAAIFAAYPDHGEAVNWIVGRLDLLATLFSLGCVWCHLRWRRSKSNIDLFLSMASFACALLSKENAILVPPLLVLVEVFLGWAATIRRGAGGECAVSVSVDDRDAMGGHGGAMPLQGAKGDRDFVHRKVNLVVSSIRSTVGYWLCLLVYLTMRKAAIGELVGGWGSQMAFYSRPIHLEILSSLQHTIIPLNNSIFGNQPGFYLVWCIFLAIAILGIVLSAVSSQLQRGFLGFLTAWFVLTLLPTYRFFLIDGNLLNSRLAFMATISLSLVLAIGFDYFVSRVRWHKAGIVLNCAFVFFSGLILYGNNQPWREAGLTVNRFIAALNTVYKNVSGDPPVQIIGVPLEKNGVYVCLNALPGMTKMPFLCRDVENCRMIDGRDTTFPVGFMKRQIEAQHSPAKFFRWADASGVLQEVVPNKMGADQVETLYPSEQNPIKLQTHLSSNRKTMDLNDLRLDCWHTEYLKIVLADGFGNSPITTPVLYFKNDVVTEYDRFNVCSGIRPNSGRRNEFTFPLGSLPNWTFGGTCRALKIKYTTNNDANIEQIYTVPSRSLAPQLGLVLKGPSDQNGAVPLTDTFSKLTISFDAMGVSGCDAVRIEVSKAALSPSIQTDPTINSRVLHGQRGITEVSKEFFHGAGLFQLRVQALNKAGKPLGCISDHLLIHI